MAGAGSVEEKVVEAQRLSKPDRTIVDDGGKAGGKKQAEEIYSLICK